MTCDSKIHLYWKYELFIEVGWPQKKPPKNPQKTQNPQQQQQQKEESDRLLSFSNNWKLIA
jgi:hypothetical protein